MYVYVVVDRDSGTVLAVYDDQQMANNAAAPKASRVVERHRVQSW